MIFNFKKITVVIIAFIALISLNFLIPAPAIAQEAPDTPNKVCGSLPEDFCQDVLSKTADNTNPLGGIKVITDAIANIIIALYGIFAVLVLVVSGVQLSASAGNEAAVKNAKENVLKIVTGLVLLVSFRAILGIIDTAFSGVNTTGNLFEAGPNNGLQLTKEGIPTLLGNIISIASFFSGIVAVIFIIVGGIRLITSAGSPKAIEGARKTIIYAVAGLVLSISAYGILVFIQSQLTR
jgi:hypothetical protein